MHILNRKPTMRWTKIKNQIEYTLSSIEEVKTSSPENLQAMANWTSTLEDMHNSVIEILIAELKKEME